MRSNGERGKSKNRESEDKVTVSIKIKDVEGFF